MLKKTSDCTPHPQYACFLFVSVSCLQTACCTASCFYRSGKTALIWAAEKGHLDIAKELLKAKADPNMTDKK